MDTEVHSNFHVLDEFEVKQDEDQALEWFQIDYEFPLGNCFIVLEEEHDIFLIKSTNGGICESIILMEEYCKELVHISSPHTFNSSISGGDENWVKVFFLLVLHEEQKAPPFFVDDLMINPWGLKIAPFP